MVDEVNELLYYNSGIYGYTFIDNKGIREEHLRDDGVHLNQMGINILANNFLAHLNRRSLLPPDWDD